MPFYSVFFYYLCNMIMKFTSMSKKLSCFLIAMMLICDVPFTHAQQEDEYILVFSDEFNQTTESQPDPTKWGCSSRHNSRWARWISNSPKVAYIKNGKLICRAIPNNQQKEDTAQMLTGAIETKDKFSFQYGKVEVRLKTNRQRGNFPAVWMLPQPPCLQHPYGGEIDIFESYGTNPHAYHTAHTHWTLHLGMKKTPQHQFHEKVRVDKWHVYCVEWNHNSIIWKVDDNIMGIYNKLDDDEAQSKGQWPFDHPFYIILNQSVGDATWPDPPNLRHTYTTMIDWIRVYQRKES